MVTVKSSIYRMDVFELFEKATLKVLEYGITSSLRSYLVTY